MCDEFDYLDQGSMNVAEYEAHFYALSGYSYVSISIESEKFQNFVKGLDISLELATSQMVIFEASFIALWITPR